MRTFGLKNSGRVAGNALRAAVSFMYKFTWKVITTLQSTALTPFDVMDVQRRAFGKWLDSAGLGPIETPSRIVLTRRLFTLKAYGAYEPHNPVVLVIPAPIKRAYIWDMLPQFSAVLRLLESHINVYVLNWERPGPGDGGAGLDQYASRFILDCLGAIAAETGQDRVFLSGHSLGGTLATIFSSLYPERIRGLILIATPLHFGPGMGDLDNLVAVLPPARLMTLVQGNVPGSMLNLVTLIASPIIFGILRWTDRLQSMTDEEAFRTHICVERWILDEAPIARHLFEDVVESLYRNDLLFRNQLKFSGKLASLANVRAPVLGVIDESCTIVPPRSFLPAVEGMRSKEKRVLWYEGDCGVAIRHVGPLVGRSSHRRIWPKISQWIKAR